MAKGKIRVIPASKAKQKRKKVKKVHVSKYTSSPKASPVQQQVISCSCSWARIFLKLFEKNE